jgi:hypothetical protein
MGFLMLSVPTIRFSARRIVVAVAAAAFVAAVFVQFDGTPRAASSPGIADEAMMRLLSDEHAAIAGYLKQEAAARTHADELAARDLERMKIAALDEAQAKSLRLAQAVTPVHDDKPKVGIVRVVAKSDVTKSEPVRVTSGSAVTGEPMQLLAMTDMQAVQAPPPRGLVRGRLHQLASTVERIPSWFNAAAGWVVDTVPVPRMPPLPQLPMRHFRV